MDVFKEFLVGLGLKPEQAIPVAVGIVVVVVSLVVVRLLKKEKKTVISTEGEEKSGAVLLLGPSGAGKTALRGRLVLGEFVASHMSMTASQARSLPRWPKLFVVDIPGHMSLRQNWTNYSKPRAIAFVVNSAEWNEDVSRDAADFLYDVLKNKALADRRTPVFVFCNKADLDMAVDTETIKRDIETELERKRMVEKLDHYSEEDIVDFEHLPEGTDYDAVTFTFENALLPVEFGRGSARNDELSDFYAFLDKL